MLANLNFSGGTIMKSNNKIISMLSRLLAVVLIFCTLSTNVSALEVTKEKTGQISYPILFNSTESSTDVLEKSVDTAEFRSYLVEQFSTFTGRVDISKFKISYTTENKNAITSLIWYNMPEAFQVSGLRIAYMNNYIIAILVTYNDWCSVNDYPIMYTQMQNAASKLLDGIEDNELLTDVEKALLIHDRLAVWNEYDYSSYLAGNLPEESFTAYGALVKRTSVCDGYTKAYIYLLNRVGIKSIYCSSQELCHSWNIVYIDNIPYHVDVTWDDKVWDVTGRVYHENFLVSTDMLYALKHTANDYDTSPQDDRYDDYYWRDSNTEFQLIDNALYFIDNSNSTLNQIKGGTITKLKSVSDIWYAGGGYYIGNFSKLSSDGCDLFYSLSNAVYEFDISSKTSNAVFYPDLTVGDDFSIYGFAFEDGYFICDLNDSPNFSSNTKESYQLKKLYDKQVPTATITASNKLAPIQTVTLNLSDSAGIDGYYWGTNSSYADNTYTATDSTHITKTVANAGTYYLVVKSINGKISVPKSITFYKTTLDGNGGSVSPTEVLTAKGNSFTFPTPVRKGYDFKGWSTSSEISGITSVTPDDNITYYAIWKKTSPVLTGITIISKPNKTTYYVGDSLSTHGLTLKLTYSDGSTKTVSQGFKRSGFDSTTAGTKTVTITYGGKTTSFKVNVIKRNASKPATPVLSSKSSTTVTLKKVTGCQYSKDGKTWQSSNVFTGLTANTTYTFYQRVAETSKNHASSASSGLKVKTNPKETLVKQNGIWYYTVNDQKTNTTTLVKYNNTWYYVKNGKMSNDNTLVNYKGIWYHVNGGKMVNDTTLVKYGNTWIYVKNGKKCTDNTLVKYNGAWYHVKNGTLANDTTLVKYGNTWYYVKNGKMNSSNTLVKYGNSWYHVKGGKLVKDTTLVKYGNSWIYVKNGKKCTDTTLVKYGNKWYYVQKGIVNFKANTKVKYNGKWHTVRNGVVK